MIGDIHITVKEKIIIHLLENFIVEPIFEAPKELSQDGIASAIGTRRSYVASAIKGLIEKGLVKENKARVKGEQRKRKIYLLTIQGLDNSRRLKDFIENKKITVLKNGDQQIIKISEINSYYNQNFLLTEILTYINQEGIFQLPHHEKIPQKKKISLDIEKQEVSEIFPPKKFIKPEIKKIELLLIGISAAYFSIILFDLIAGMENDFESVYTFLLIIIPIYIIILFPKIVPKNIRARISIISGTFFILFGIFLAFPYKIFNWHEIYAPYWLIFGITLFIISFEIKRIDDLELWNFVSIGVFIFISLFCCNILWNEKLSDFEKICTIFWILLSIILIFFWLLKPEKMFMLFKVVPSLLIGSLFIVIGLLLMSYEKYFESFFEYIIGLPIIVYSLKNLAFENRSQLILQLLFLICLVLLEVLTCLTVLFDF